MGAARFNYLVEVTEDEFFDRWGRRETDRLDFKTNADDLHPTIAAMAMSAGGVILVGVRERPGPLSAVGVRHVGRTVDLVAEAGQCCGVDLSSEAVEVAGVTVVVTVVPQVTGRIVTTPDGRLLRRAGTQNLPLTGDQLAAFVMDRRQISGEMDVVPGAGEDDLDVRLLNRLLQREGRRAATRRTMGSVLAADRFLPDAGSPMTKVALLLFTDQVELFLPPRKGRRHILRLIRELLFFEPGHDGTDIPSALAFLNHVQRRRSIVFLLTDFLHSFGAPVSDLALQSKSITPEGVTPARSGRGSARDVIQEIGLTNARHDLVCVHLHDPREGEWPRAGLVTIEDAETGELLEIDSSRAAVRDRFARTNAERLGELDRALNRAGVDTLRFSTAAPFAQSLQHFFETRRGRRRG